MTENAMLYESSHSEPLELTSPLPEADAGKLLCEAHTLHFLPGMTGVAQSCVAHFLNCLSVAVDAGNGAAQHSLLSAFADNLRMAYAYYGELLENGGARNADTQQALENFCRTAYGWAKQYAQAHGMALHSLPPFLPAEEPLLLTQVAR